VYRRLLDMCVDGIMAARPAALERVLRARRVVRPNGRGVDPCGVEAEDGVLEPSGLLVNLRRRGLGPQEFRGTVTVRELGRGGAVIARGRFRMREGRELAEPILRYNRAWLRQDEDDDAPGGLPNQRPQLPRSVRAVATVRVRGARGEPVRTRIRLRPLIVNGGDR
jgi:hypothetical protein